MAKADAGQVPAGGIFSKLRLGGGHGMGVAGNAKIIAAPAYERLLAIEPYLKRAIPDPYRHLPRLHRGSAASGPHGPA